MAKASFVEGLFVVLDHFVDFLNFLPQQSLQELLLDFFKVVLLERLDGNEVVEGPVVLDVQLVLVENDFLAGGVVDSGGKLIIDRQIVVVVVRDTLEVLFRDLLVGDDEVAGVVDNNGRLPNLAIARI